MEIRDIETIKKYNEAKKFVEQYERQYRLALVSTNCLDNDIWNLRYEIQYRIDRLKKLGKLNEPKHPYNIQIENRKRYIKDKLKQKYGVVDL
jgi:hypothetical protein